MTDFLTAVKTARTHPTIATEPASGELHIRESKRSYTKSDQTTTTPSSSSQTDHPQQVTAPSETPEDALKVLRTEPETDTLIATLNQLSNDHGFPEPFRLALPGPLQAQIINTLLSTIIPTFWAILDSRNRTLLTKCLTNVAGFNALFSKLRLLCSSAAQDQGNNVPAIRDLLDVADHLLRDDDCVARLWTCLDDVSLAEVKRLLVWKEAINLLGSGKIVAIVAQAEDIVRKADTTARTTLSRLSSGTEYAVWLGSNIALLSTSHGSDPSRAKLQAAANLLTKALNLGYPTSLLSGLLRCLLAKDLQVPNDTSSLRHLAPHLPQHARRKLLEIVMHWLSGVGLSLIHI